MRPARASALPQLGLREGAEHAHPQRAGLHSAPARRVDGRAHGRGRRAHRHERDLGVVHPVRNDRVRRPPPKAASKCRLHVRVDLRTRAPSLRDAAAGAPRSRAESRGRRPCAAGRSPGAADREVAGKRRPPPASGMSVIIIVCESTKASWQTITGRSTRRSSARRIGEERWCRTPPGCPRSRAGSSRASRSISVSP